VPAQRIGRHELPMLEASYLAPKLSRPDSLSRSLPVNLEVEWSAALSCIKVSAS
jgi:hypothetical protein